MRHFRFCKLEISLQKFVTPKRYPPTLDTSNRLHLLCHSPGISIKPGNTKSEIINKNVAFLVSVKQNVMIFSLQNTYTNAEKLLAAAAELAQTGECTAEDIYSVAHELESHISSFASRVEQRRRLLELAILFYSHTEEVSCLI